MSNEKYDTELGEKLKSDKEFREEYIDTLPDLQNGPESLIKGAPVSIEHVGIHNFKVPVRYEVKNGEPLTLETSITGTVSLEAHKKGINMSRIMRSFYEIDDNKETFQFDELKDMLLHYKSRLESFDANLKMKFSYPMRIDSLRSNNSGWQYYDVMFEAALDKDGNFRPFIHFDFVYSSSCPCSYELSQHAEKTRGVTGVPHSQRSFARISLELNDDSDADTLWIEDIRDIALDALKTETQVVVKREDEQAFAELNAVYLKFVEDAVRLLYEKFDAVPQVKAFKVVASHNESLHSHSAIASIQKNWLQPADYVNRETWNDLDRMP